MLLVIIFSAIKIKHKGKRSFNNQVRYESNIRRNQLDCCLPAVLLQDKITMGPQPLCMLFCLLGKSFLTLCTWKVEGGRIPVN